VRLLLLLVAAVPRASLLFLPLKAEPPPLDALATTSWWHSSWSWNPGSPSAVFASNQFISGFTQHVLCPLTCRRPEPSHSTQCVESTYCLIAQWLHAVNTVKFGSKRAYNCRALLAIPVLISDTGMMGGRRRQPGTSCIVEVFEALRR
jgi:hypothetical protein